MDLSDAAAKARKEMDGMIASFHPLSTEEHEAIKNLLLGIQCDAGLAESALYGHYERISSKHFAIVK